jgi:leucyl-tRNA synthetase
MGWDAFGLPAENAAIERGEKPDEWTLSNIDNMKKQLVELCCSFDWHRELATCDPSYYKWTQYIFLRMFQAGLVYQKQAAVNWDPIDETVLADEQIDEKGCSWRSGAVVQKRYLKQWYIRTTAYSKALLDGLQQVDADMWRDIINLQAHWIGKCDGIRLEFQLRDSGGHELPSNLSVFTRTPEAIYGLSHICVANNHYLCDQLHLSMESQMHSSAEMKLPFVAIHPFTGGEIPVFCVPSMEYGEHLDALLGIPSVNPEDMKFAIRHSLNFVDVYNCEKTHVTNSSQFSGLSISEAFTAISEYAKELNCGGHVTSERARDWLISRQRYWGTPIPIIHCPKYGAVPVPYEDLPVTLPIVTEFRGHGVSPLASAGDWLKVKCPKCDCDGFGQRETDTMDTFVDSSWYFLRYLDSSNQQQLVSSDCAKLMPVDLYIGGKEHAILHLYYARFINHFLHDIGIVPCREPFINLLTQGMVMGRSYRLKDTGRYLRQEQVDFSGKLPVHKDTGAALVVEWEKMSKSKYNGVDPEDILNEYGTDSTRLCILSNVAPKSDRPWSNDVFVGVLRWQSRIWSLVSDFIAAQKSNKNSCELNQKLMETLEIDIFNWRNFILKEVTFHMEKTFLLNTAISRLQSLTNWMKKLPRSVVSHSQQYERLLAELVIMISPFAPMFACELWSGLASVLRDKMTNKQFDWGELVLDQQWPTLDTNYRLPMTIKLNGREIFDVELPMPYRQTNKLTEHEAVLLAQQHPSYTQIVGNQLVLGHRLTFDERSLRVELELNTIRTAAQTIHKLDS